LVVVPVGLAVVVAGWQAVKANDRQIAMMIVR
jgi:hypothetical protein